MNIEKRAKQLLSRLAHYHDMSIGSTQHDERVRGLVLQQGEKCLGYYVNDVNEEKDLIVITNVGLHRIFEGHSTCVCFEHIASTKAPPDKALAWELSIKLTSGETVVVPITGGEGKYRDAFTFLTFLGRVIRDFQKAKDMK